MISRRTDGIVVTGLIHSQTARDQLRRAGIPVVETWDLSDRPVDMAVGFSHLKVGSAIAGYFLGQGGAGWPSPRGDDQRPPCGARASCPRWATRCRPWWCRPRAASNTAARRWATLLAQDPDIEAIYCSSDQLAQGVMIEAHARGLRMPQDLAICGFGDADFAAHMNPPLTTVHVDGAQIGELAARQLLARFRGEPVPEPVIDVGFRIIERGTT